MVKLAILGMLYRKENFKEKYFLFVSFVVDGFCFKVDQILETFIIRVKMRKVSKSDFIPILINSIRSFTASESREV